MALGDDDLELFTGGDFGVDVRVAGYSATGVFDAGDVMLQDGAGFGVVSRRQSLLIKYGALGTLSQDQAITIDGSAYVIRLVEGEAPDFKLQRITIAGGDD